MRRSGGLVIALTLALAMLAPPTLAPGATSAPAPYLVLADWQEGRFVAGAPEPIDEPPLNAVRIPLLTDDCPRRAQLDLLYEPTQAGATVPGAGEAGILYEFRAQLWHDGALVSTATIRHSGYGHTFGLVDGEGEYELRIWLRVGVDVGWEARVRGKAVASEAGCMEPVRVTEVEANPGGPDAGAEWIEIHNPGTDTLDLSEWTIETTHGATTALVLPGGTWLAPDARLVVTFTQGQALDNQDESVRLIDPLGTVRDTTPVHSDTADDARTWQRHADGAWTFETETPGS